MNLVRQLSFGNVSRWQCSVGTHTVFLILSSQAASLIVVKEQEQLHYLSLTVHLGVYTPQYCCNFVCMLLIIFYYYYYCYYYYYYYYEYNHKIRKIIIVQLS